MLIFNHGLFQKQLEEKIEDLMQIKSSKKDPYEQWNTQEQINILKEIHIVYKKSVDDQLNK